MSRRDSASVQFFSNTCTNGIQDGASTGRSGRELRGSVVLHSVSFVV